MTEVTKYTIISTVMGGTYLIGILGWKYLQSKVGLEMALTYVGRIFVWGLGIVLLFLTVGSIVIYVIRSMTHTISQVL